MKARRRRPAKRSGEPQGRLDETRTWILKETLDSLRQREKKAHRPQP